MIVFWFFTSGSDAMGYSLMFLWIILPVTTFVVSIVIGKNDFWEKGKCAFTLFFGVMYMLAEYGTFKMANNIAFDKLNAPDWGMIVVGAIISAIGMVAFATNIIFTPEDKSGIIICKAVQRREGQQNERAIAV